MTDRRRTLTRRRVIQLFALTAINASTLAGCTGDDESTAEGAENENGEITTDDMETHALTVSLVD